MGTLTVGNLELTSQNKATHNSKGRFRLADSRSLLDIDFTTGKSPDFAEELVENGGTCEHDQASGSVILKSNGLTGRAVYQSKEYLGPRAGASLTCFLCGNINASTVNDGQGSTRMGFFDSHEDKVSDSTGCGVFLECVGGNLFIVKRTYTSDSTQVDERIAMENWNTDVMDGSSSLENPSGLKLVSDECVVFVVDVDGMKGVRMGFVLDNQIVYTHLFNDTVLPRKKLPVRAEISNTVSTISLSVSSFSVESDGSSSLVRGIGRHVDTDTVLLVVDGTSSNCFCTVRLGVVIVGDSPVKWRILLDASPDSPSWKADGGIEVDQASTTLTGGTVIKSGFARGCGRVAVHTDSILLTLPALTSTIAGTPHTYSIEFQAVGGVAVDLSASLEMTEIF